MAKIGRRAALGSLAAASVGAIPNTRSPLPQGSSHPTIDSDVKALGLAAMRLINTVQNAIGNQPGGEYLQWQDLTQSAPFNLALDSWHLREHVSLQPETDLLATFRVNSIAKAPDRGHSTMLVDRLSGFAYASDERGVINVGSCVNRTTGRPSFDFADFSGGPLVRPRSRPVGLSLGHVVGRFAEFFMPTLKAQSCGLTCSCCCDQSCGYCNGCDNQPCGGACACTPACCCNTGFLVCTWCCTSCSGDYGCCCVLGCGG
jgi:hypothetical protein